MTPDHEKNALVNMLQEGFGREIQLRAALSQAQLQLAEANEEISQLKLRAEQAAAAELKSDAAAKYPTAEPTRKAA